MEYFRLSNLYEILMASTFFKALSFSSKKIRFPRKKYLQNLQNFI